MTVTCSLKWSESCSVMSNFFQPHGLYSPWNSPGQNTGVGSLSLLQGIFPAQGSNPGLPHCRRILHQLSHKGSPIQTAQSRDQRLSVTGSPYDKHVISERPATWSLHARSGGQFLISDLISACTVPWAAPVSHWSLPFSFFSFFSFPLFLANTCQKGL